MSEEKLTTVKTTKGKKAGERTISIYPPEVYVKKLGGWHCPRLSLAVSLLALHLDKQIDTWDQLSQGEQTVFRSVCDSLGIKDPLAYYDLGERLASIVDLRFGDTEQGVSLSRKLKSLHPMEAWKLYFFHGVQSDG